MRRQLVHTDCVDFLGFVITPNGVKMDQKKLAAVRDWPAPTTVKEVQSFLGFGNFYRRFISSFGKMARLLHDLTKKDVPFAWTEVHS